MNQVVLGLVLKVQPELSTFTGILSEVWKETHPPNSHKIKI